jgi:hypothetical protein
LNVEEVRCRAIVFLKTFWRRGGIKAVDEFKINFTGLFYPGDKRFELSAKSLDEENIRSERFRDLSDAAMQQRARWSIS